MRLLVCKFPVCMSILGKEGLLYMGMFQHGTPALWRHMVPGIPLYYDITWHQGIPLYYDVTWYRGYPCIMTSLLSRFPVRMSVLGKEGLLYMGMFQHGTPALWRHMVPGIPLYYDITWHQGIPLYYDVTWYRGYPCIMTSLLSRFPVRMSVLGKEGLLYMGCFNTVHQHYDVTWYRGYPCIMTSHGTRGYPCIMTSHGTGDTLVLWRHFFLDFQYVCPY